MDVVLICIAVFIYLLPFLLSVNIEGRRGVYIIILDVLFGWTVIGWIVAMGLFLSRPRRSF